MILLLSEADVARVVSMADGVRVVEDALRQHAVGGGVAMPRISADVPGNGGAFRIMPAIMPEIEVFGLKTLTGYPGRRLPGETYFVVMLFSCDSGALRAIVSGNRLTGVRTGAATGVAAKYLSRPNSQTLGVIGAGVQARHQVAALLEVRSLKEIRIFDIETAKADAFAREIETDFHVRARATRAVREAVSECDLVVTATAAKTPVLDGHWLDEGTHVSGMGSNTPNKRELDGTAFARSTIVVDFKEQALQEAGDLRDALRTGAISGQAVDVELGDVIAGQKPGRQSEREITLFKSVGMAIEDVATATFAYQRALVEGLGTRIDFEASNVQAVAAGLARFVAADPLRAGQS